MGAELTPGAVEALYERQLAVWETARRNYEALAHVRTRRVAVGAAGFILQHNPARIGSTSASVDKDSILGRECFLCRARRPVEQEEIVWNGYDVVVNPYPIFPRHFTIISRRHEWQSIMGRVGDMMALAKLLDGFTVLYNGVRCGASAPYHMHFQAIPQGELPVEGELARATGGISPVAGLGRAVFVIKATETTAGGKLFDALMAALPSQQDGQEPMVNVLCWHKDGDGWTLALFPRRRHRPSCYYAEGSRRIMVSPGSVDMGGVMVMPLENDFERVTAGDIKQILAQVSLGCEEVMDIYRNLKA